MKRSQQKIITRTAKVLKYMRVTKHISMREAGRLSGLSDSAISHYEHGRMEVSERRLQQLIKIYGFTSADYERLASGQFLAAGDLKSECVGLIEMIDPKMLKTVHSVLSGFLT